MCPSTWIVMLFTSQSLNPHHALVRAMRVGVRERERGGGGADKHLSKNNTLIHFTHTQVSHSHFLYYSETPLPRIITVTP